MNNLDKQYQALLQDILDNGVRKEDRTGTGTLSVFGRTIRHKMSEGFPLLTTKKMYFKGIVTELLWFLRGDTNIQFLHDNDCHIWDGDYEKSGRKDGELGPIYGKQWRDWGGYDNSYLIPSTYNLDLSIQRKEELVKDWKKGTDQIANLIRDLKTNPDSRRLMVSAWNVGELDQMVLPPCHYGFQVYTRELSFDERVEYFKKTYPGKWDEYELPKDNFSWYNIPKRAISLMWNQRSVDTFLGLPFNIASYGLLLEIIAKEVNMVPDELIGNLGDTHLYLNHIEQAKEQIGEIIYEDSLTLYSPFHKDGIQKKIPIGSTREPYPLPKLFFKYEKETYIDDYELDGFVLKDYQSHPTIKAPLSN